MKKIPALTLIILSLTLILNTVVTGNRGIILYINEDQISLYPLPRLVGGTTLIPVRAFFEGFGAVVHFDAKSEEITVFRGSKQLALKKSDGIVYHNGTAYAPIRLMSQSLGDEIIYVDTDRSIRIKSEFDWTRKYLPPQEKPVSVSGQRGIVAITFDDGPGIYTNRIIDILKKHDAGATFFVLGCNIPGNEGIIKRIADEGFEIGNHTFDHQILSKFKPEQVNKTLDQFYHVLESLPACKIEDVMTLCYPGGEIPTDRSSIEKYSYKGKPLLGAFTAWGGRSLIPIHPKADRYNLPRYDGNDEHVMQIVQEEFFRKKSYRFMLPRFYTLSINSMKLFLKEHTTLLQHDLIWNGNWINSLDEAQGTEDK